jgi:tripartite-type tricarboxylate transporter receptor subunit TctC
MRGVSTPALALLALAATLIFSWSGAAADENFYRGKTLTIVVGSSPGGAYDAYGRLLARYLARHLAGSPNIIVQDMPGAGSLTAVRYLDTNAPTDGTVIASFNPGLITQSIISPETVKLNFGNLYWLGGITHEFRVCYAWHTTGVKTWEELVAADHFVMGAAGIGTGAYLDGAALRNVFGIKLRQIGGYPGSTEERLAIERGELDGACSEWNALPADWIRDGKIFPLVRWLRETPDGFPKDVPYVVDLVASADDKTILTTLASPSEVGNPFAVSRQVPSDRRQMLREAFAATMADKDFLAEAARQNMPVEPSAGAAAQVLVDSIYKSATPELAGKIKNAMK